MGSAILCTYPFLFDDGDEEWRTWTIREIINHVAEVEVRDVHDDGRDGQLRHPVDV